MPGSNGNFLLEIDATGSEVEIEYKVEVIESKNIPVNMRFYAEIKDIQGGVIKKTKEYEKFEELSSKELKRKNSSRRK